MLFKHTSGDLYELAYNFGPWWVLRPLKGGSLMHVSPEFKHFYTELQVH